MLRICLPNEESSCRTKTIRQWCGKFGPDYARQLKRRQGRLGDTWFLDEVFVTITVSASISGARWIKTVI